MSTDCNSSDGSEFAFGYCGFLVFDLEWRHTGGFGVPEKLGFFVCELECAFEID